MDYVLRNKSFDDAHDCRSGRERQDQALRDLGFDVVTRRGTKLVFIPTRCAESFRHGSSASRRVSQTTLNETVADDSDACRP